MNDKQKYHLNPSFTTALLVISIVLTGFLTYKEMLRYFFTSPDTFQFILSNKVQSFNDIFRILKEPLMPGALAFYRPVLRLSFSLDHFLSGLNPFGYHMTALLLHISVAISVFFLMISLKCSKITAWMSAIIFCTHPITVASVLEITRSHDVLSVLFVLLSIIYTIKHLSSAHYKRTNLFLSLFFYLLALGSKEIAVISPAVIFAYLMVIHLSNEKFLIKRLVKSLIKCIPYFVITFFFLILRARIISEVIRYPNLFGKSLSTFQTIKAQLKIIIDYFTDLIYPVKYLYFIPDFFLNTTLFLLVLFISIFFRKSIIRRINYKSWSTNFLIGSDEAKQLFFLFIFLLLPLAVYIVTVTFDHRYMYLPLIPFSAILSVIIVEGFKYLLKQINRPDFAGFDRRLFLINYKVISTLLATAVSFSLFAYSPILRSYREYEYNGNVAKVMFDKVTDILSNMPDDTVINLYNMPGRILYHGDIPPVRSIFCLDPGTLKIWLDLNYPNNKYSVTVHNTIVYEIHKRDLDSKIHLEIKTDDINGVIDVIFPTS